MEEPELIPVAKAASELKLSNAVVFKYLRLGLLKRYKRWGDQRTYIDKAELKKLLRPRVVRAKRPAGKQPK